MGYFLEKSQIIDKSVFTPSYSKFSYLLSIRSKDAQPNQVIKQF